MSSPRPCRILLIAGSLRAGSTNAAVLATAARVAPAGVSAQLYDGMAELPAFNPDDDREPLPAPAARLRALLDESDAVLFCTPEYAGTLPGAFKNLLDWTVGGGMYEKPVGFINASPMGAATGAHHTLRTVLGYINAILVEGACAQIPVRRDAVGSDGTVADPQLRAAIAAVVTVLRDYVAAGRSRETQ
jgi:chromate reductase